MGKVGFGSYRVSVRSKEHREALLEALRAGCSLIDTSANYTNGDSELLIGEVLKEHPELTPKIVSKAGYIQGKNLEILNSLHQNGKALDDLVNISEDLKHSIHPEFLENQLGLSLERLQKESLDCYLLHNPEYYFQQEGATQAEYYQRIEKALLYLESEVTRGRIKSYGISSNNFILPLNHEHVTNFENILAIIKKHQLKSFKMIQFPFNLIEIGALEKLGDYGDQNLLEQCMASGIETMGNRPLNAFSQNSLIRLATYESSYRNLDDEAAKKHFEYCLALLKEKWIESSDEVVTADDFLEVDLIKQWTQLWNNLPTPDSVEQVYYGRIFPFLARVWGGGLTFEESKPFYSLLDLSFMYSRKNMSSKALHFQNQAHTLGLLEAETERPFATSCIETYLDYGLDYVLVGMKKTEYVDQLKHLF